MNALAYLAGQKRASLAIGLNKSAMEQLPLPFDKKEPSKLLGLVKKYPYLALGGAIGAGYGGYRALKNKPPSPQMEPPHILQNPLDYQGNY